MSRTDFKAESAGEEHSPASCGQRNATTDFTDGTGKKHGFSIRGSREIRGKKSVLDKSTHGAIKFLHERSTHNATGCKRVCQARFISIGLASSRINSNPKQRNFDFGQGSTMLINKSPMRSFFNRRIISVGIVACLMLFGSIIISTLIRHRHESRKNACISNLLLIDSCKQQWALEQRKQATDVFTVTDFWNEFWGPKPFNEAELPSCPNDPAQSFRTSYQIRGVGELPICLIDPKNHVLPPR